MTNFQHLSQAWDLQWWLREVDRFLWLTQKHQRGHCAHKKNEYKTDNNEELTVDTLFQLLVQDGQNLELAWLTWLCIIYIDHSDWVKETCQSRRNSYYEQVDNHCPHNRQAPPHHTNIMTIRYTDTTTITQNLLYAITAPGVVLVSTNATAYIASCSGLCLSNGWWQTIHKH